MKLPSALNLYKTYEKSRNFLNRYEIAIRDKIRSSALDVYKTSLDLYRTSQHFLKRNLDKEVVANACFLAAWPLIAPGDTSLNYQQLNMLTNGENNLRATVNAVRTFIQLIQTHLPQYLPQIKDLF